ncbi:MAG: methionyl-tRNA formyltransferase [Bacteroidia bacterium]|nr:methionyl-tRNA formyltransferase [Bacteroidia bacterium]NNJ54805.1 methionyl-tRNA formyltransferase [Bacteroidia bacterium]
MNKKDLRIIFLGNPEFARYHLERILDNGYNVVAVISAPDKPAGRGMKVNATPVTMYAREKDIPCLQPKNLKNPEFIEELKSYKADLQIVIAFRMLPEVVWNMPRLGTYNLHASLLPEYRGAAPINWAIINGETKTGVSTFKLKHEIDTGNLLVQKECAIQHSDNAGTLHDKLMHLGAEAIVETLDQIVSETISEIPQANSPTLKNAPKLFTANTKVEWNKAGEEIYNFIRGLSPYPVAHTSFDNKNMKIYATENEPSIHSYSPGTFASDNKNYLKVATTDGWLNLLDIKLEGKRRMPIKDFLNGYDISHLGLTVL